MYFLKDTLFIHQLWGVYETFYKNHKYYPVGQDELLKSISDEENPGLKTKMIFFRCTALVKNDTLYIYEYGFNKKNDNLSPYIDNLNNITFLNGEKNKILAECHKFYPGNGYLIEYTSTNRNEYNLSKNSSPPSS